MERAVSCRPHESWEKKRREGPLPGGRIRSGLGTFPLLPCKIQHEPPLLISTVNGGIRVRDGSFEEAKCSTVSGDLVWSAGLSNRASLGLQTHSGSILLELPRAIDAEFDVSTFSGKIVNGLGPEAKRTDPYVPGYELHFELGSASAEIEMSSFSGDVEIRAK